LIKAIKYFPPALLAEYPSKWQMPHPPIPEPPPINPLPDLRKGIYILTVLINAPLVFPCGWIDRDESGWLGDSLRQI
jgi:hypothetical protein